MCIKSVEEEKYLCIIFVCIYVYIYVCINVNTHSNSVLNPIPALT